MKKRVLSTLLVLCMALSLLPTTAFASSTGNLIQNPGGEIMPNNNAELGAVGTGWQEDGTTKYGKIFTTDMAGYIGVPIHGGSHMMGFDCGETEASVQSSCYQIIPLPSRAAGSSVSYLFTGFMEVPTYANGTGTAVLKIEQLNQNGTVLSTDSREATNTPVETAQWLPYTMTGNVAVDAVQLRVSIGANLNAPIDGLNFSTALFDDLSLILTTTLPEPAATPDPPTIGTGENQPTDTSIAVSTVAGQEYVISASASDPASWSGADYFKATAGGIYTFTGLTPASRYYIHTRTPGSDTTLPSASAKTEQYTLPTAPAAGAVTIDYAAETIGFDGIYEVSTKNDGTGTAITSAITPGAAAQTVYVRVKAVSGGAPASAWTAVTIPARPAVGAALTVDNAAETVTVPAGYGCRIGSGSDVSAVTDTAVSLAPGATLTYWKTAAAAAFRSDSASVAAPARLAAPSAPAINAAEKTLATTAAMQYRTDGGSWTACTDEMAFSDFGWSEGTALRLQVRLAATDTSYASEPAAVVIPPHVAASVPGKTDETLRGKADGTLTGLDSTMEYRLAADAAWTTVSGSSVTGLPAGTYEVRYAAGEGYAASTAAAVTIAAGRRMTVALPLQQTGYTLTADKAEFDWHEDVTLTFTLKDGYTRLSHFAVTVNGVSVTPDAQGQATVAAPTDDLTVAVAGVADVTAPAGEIAVGENRWTGFLNTVTFGLFFKETQTVTVTAADAGSGMAKAEYLLSGTVFTDAAQVDGTWNSLVLDSAGRGSFGIAPNSRQFVYVRLTDAADNAVILNSAGIVLYTDSAADTQTITYQKGADTDRTAAVTLNGNSIAAVELDGTALTDAQAAVSGGTITLKAAWLDSLGAGPHTVTVFYNPLGEAYVSGSEPATTSFTVKILTKNDTPAAVFTAADRTLSGFTAGQMYRVDGGAWTPAAADLSTVVTKACRLELCQPGSADDYTADSDIQTISIGKAAAPVLSRTDETVCAKADGTVIGADDTTEQLVGGSWTAASVTGLAPGDYTYRTKADGTTLESDPVTVTIAAGRRMTVTLPLQQTGYTLTADKAEFDWHEDVTLTFTLKDGYTRLSHFAVTVNGVSVTPDAQGQATVAAPTDDLTVAVAGVADVTAPTGEIAVGENRWTGFLNTVTFGLFFKETQTVTVTAADAGSGMAKAEYLLSDTVFTDAAQVTGTWNSLVLDSAGRCSFGIAPNSRQFVYVRLTDAAGNFAVLNSEGIVLYTSAAPGVTAAEFNPDKQADIAIPLTLNGNTLTAVRNGENTLSEGTDYTLSGGILTVGKAYLAAALTGDSLRLTLFFAPMGVDTDKVAMTADCTVVKHIHTWDGGVITTRPTISAEGVTTYTCTACGVTKTEPAEKLASSRQTITDGTEKATVSGVLTEGAQLTITPISGGSGYDTLIKLVDADQNEVIGAYEATVTGQYLGQLILTFTVDARYNGKTLTIYHEKKDGATEVFARTAENGRVSVTVDELSPFLLTAVKEAGGTAGQTYTITVSAGEGGSFSTGKTVTVRADESVSFTITPDKGYRIADVTVDGKSVGAVDSYVFTHITDDHTITAAFQKTGGTGETPAAPDAKPETPAAPDAKPETPAAPDAKPETPAAPDAKPETPAAPDAKPETPAVPDAKPETPAAPDAKPETPSVSATAETPAQNTSGITAPPSGEAAAETETAVQKTSGMAWLWLIPVGAAAAILLFLRAGKRKKDER